MKFILIGKIESCRWSQNEESPNAAFLYFVKEKTDKFEKTWKVWTKVKLELNIRYQLEGYISEQPNKKRNDQFGKAVYETNFNVTDFKKLEDHIIPDGFEHNQNIPF